uniref:Uncharacterized protein n=1 Tax=Arundo donax TaxID=35708 RepID=A0A0A9AC34_ARUDO
MHPADVNPPMTALQLTILGRTMPSHCSIRASTSNASSHNPAVA